MSSRKRRRIGNGLIIESPSPTINITLVNQRTPINTNRSIRRADIAPSNKGREGYDYFRAFTGLAIILRRPHFGSKRRRVKMKVKQLITTLLGDEEARNTIDEATDIYSELVNAVVNILHKKPSRYLVGDGYL